jgi:hypothetical protein
MAYVQLAQGMVAARYVEDQRGQRQQVSIDMLRRIDNDRGLLSGPFNR